MGFRNFYGWLATVDLGGQVVLFGWAGGET